MHKSEDEEDEDEKFFQIRVKSIKFLQKKATAIYFYDVTNHIRSLKLSSKVLQQEETNAFLSLSQVTFTQQVKAPLNSILMLCESLMKILLDQMQKQLLLIIVSQVNLLLCYFNDILDLKKIECGDFVTKKVEFKPLETFSYVMRIFEHQAELQRSKLTLKISDTGLPQCLFGDQIRLRQVLINLLKYALIYSFDKEIKI